MKSIKGKILVLFFILIIAIFLKAKAMADTFFITNVEISNVTSNGYTVTCRFSVPVKLEGVYMPTWSDENGQDDIIWYEANVNENIATFTVDTSRHNGNSGKYHTHIYVYDKVFGKTMQDVEVEVPKATLEPEVKNVKVTNVNDSGYTITCNISTPRGLKVVYMPTWTNNNGQDDIIWYEASVNGDVATFTVDTSNHNSEGGVYITHIYVYDVNNEYALSSVEVEVPQKDTTKPTIVRAYVSEVSNKGFTLTCEFLAPLGVERIDMPTWSTRNGQDDIIWYKPTIDGNTASIKINTSDHNGDLEAYTTQICLYDKAGNSDILKGSTILSKWKWLYCFDVTRFCKENSSFCSTLEKNQIDDMVINFGRTLLNKPYDTSNRLGPDSFDCSGFVYYLYKNAFGAGNGVDIGNYTNAIRYNLTKYEIPIENMQRGNLLLATNGYPDGDPRQERHIAIYLGDGRILHCGLSVGKVEENYIYYFGE